MNTTMRMMALALMAWFAAPLPAAADTQAAVTFTHLHDFDYTMEGRPRNAALVKGPDGHMYGTNAGGGGFSGGTAFRIAADGTTEVLYAFGSAGKGWGPEGLTWGADGYFYGVTVDGGKFSDGTFYRMGLDGKVKQLRSFDQTKGMGRSPLHALTLSIDGNFYGVTQSNGGGTVYRMTKSGEHALLHQFESFGLGGDDPRGGVVEDDSGNLYGTTYAGGAHADGVVYRLTKTGTLTILHTFGSQRSDGASPQSHLLRIGKMLYGITLRGGLHDQGTVYRISTTGSGYEQLHSFSSLSGAPFHPAAGLVPGEGGELYGTTLHGGAAGQGAVYRISLDGQMTHLLSFGVRGVAGAEPLAALLPGGKSSFYGTTASDGADNAGTAYKLTVTD